MKKKLITGVLVIVLSLALAVPAGANDMAKAGASHPIDYNAAIKTDGTLWLWGDHTPCSKGNVPTQVAENIKAVSISGDSVAVIKTDNTLWLLNDSPNVGNVKVMDNVAAVSCNKHNSLNPAIAAIKTDGTLWMWGDNSYGQLGNGSTEDSSVPIQVMEDVSAVSIGFGHTVALKKDGSLWAWGYNSMSQLGNGWKGNVKLDYGSYIQTVPVQIMKNVVAISAGDFHTAAIKTDGTLWMWGQNDMGQLGNGNVANSKTEDGKPVQSVPLQVMKNVAAVSAGRIHTAAIKTDGSLWTWGFNRYGQIGNGDGGSIKEVKFPVRVMDKAAAVSAADYHTVALKTDGSLWAWGENRFGSVGNGGAGNMVIDENTTLQTIPVKIMTGVALPNSGTTPPPATNLPIGPRQKFLPPLRQESFQKHCSKTTPPLSLAKLWLECLLTSLRKPRARILIPFFRKKVSNGTLPPLQIPATQMRWPPTRWALSMAWERIALLPQEPLHGAKSPQSLTAQPECSAWKRKDTLTALRTLQTTGAARNWGGLSTQEFSMVSAKIGLLPTES